MDDVELVELTGWTFEEIDEAPAWRLSRLLAFARAKRRGVELAAADRRGEQQSQLGSPAGGTVVRRPVER